MDTILFIDDNAGILHMLKRRFEKLDYQVFIAENVHKGEEIYSKNQIDVICLDYMMPETSGFDFFQIFSQKYSTPVIMMTAHSSINLVIQFMKLGGADFIEKPIDIELFDIKIQKTISNHRKLNIEIEARKEAEEDLKENFQELKNKNQTLEILYEELDQFTSSVSHELRGPLRQIGLFSQILQKKGASCLNEEEKKILDTINDSALSTNKLVKELLSFAKMARGEMKTEQIDTYELVREIVNEILKESTAKNLHFDIAELPPVEADPVLLKQVFINLLDNAVKYSSKQNESRIEIGTIHKDKKEVFYVKDNGVGFDNNLKESLYKGFRRLHSPSDFAGTGIGLSNVKRIIQRHHGEVWAESKEDTGATFYFSLPTENS